MSKVYYEGKKGSPCVDSAYVARQYLAHAQEIAHYICQLDDTKDRIEYLHEVTKDAGDVHFELERAICQLGVTLASCIEYYSAYTEEANTEDEKETEAE